MEIVAAGIFGLTRLATIVDIMVKLAGAVVNRSLALFNQTDACREMLSAASSVVHRMALCGRNPMRTKGTK